MNRKLAIVLMAALGMPFAAPAQTETPSTSYSSGTASQSPDYYNRMSYTLGEARVLTEDPDRGDDADGIRLAGSYMLERNFFLRGSVMTTDTGGRYGTDTESFELGAGLRHPFTSSVDLVGVASLVRTEKDYGPFGHDEGWGPALMGGARALLAPRVEVGGYVGYREMFSDGSLGIIGEGLYHFTPNVSAIAGLMLSDDTREANLGARWNFR